MKDNRHDSQLKAIEKDLKSGKRITPLQALRDYGCMRLSARIFTLKERGMKIKTKLIDVGAYRFAQYKLVR